MKKNRRFYLIIIALSMGILVALVGPFLSFLTSEGFPLLTLSFVKKKNWYYFADDGLEAETLAQQIIKEDRNAVIIYGCSKSAREEMPDYVCLFANVSPERIAAGEDAGPAYLRLRPSPGASEERLRLFMGVAGGRFSWGDFSLTFCKSMIL